MKILKAIKKSLMSGEMDETVIRSISMVVSSYYQFQMKFVGFQEEWPLVNDLMNDFIIYLIENKKLNYLATLNNDYQVKKYVEMFLEQFVEQIRRTKFKEEHQIYLKTLMVLNRYPEFELKQKKEKRANDIWGLKTWKKEIDTASKNEIEEKLDEIPYQGREYFAISPVKNNPIISSEKLKNFYLKVFETIRKYMTAKTLTFVAENRIQLFKTNFKNIDESIYKIVAEKEMPFSKDLENIANKIYYRLTDLQKKILLDMLNNVSYKQTIAETGISKTTYYDNRNEIENIFKSTDIDEKEMLPLLKIIKEKLES
ncbi:hypothetical protein B1H10_04065 [candidate division KSB1 bacterium 4484_188]|nr:MAG: hypothetical protein B1H10_04065 [candidate division KSB1 bacterium 4484_188]